MATPASFPAIRCQLGDWAYYSTVLPFSEIASRIQQAKEINSNPGLNNMIQRELGPRVDDISHYLLQQPERFFSAIVVGVYGGAPDWFPVEIGDPIEPQPTNLSELAKESLGIMQLSGEERLFAVDGQHRVEGIKEALKADAGLASEELAVLFVAHRESPEGIARTRRLFTTLNKYAKRVTTSEIIALDEDDAFAVVTRMIVNQYEGLNKITPMDGVQLSLVRFEGAQIPSGDRCSITTVQTLYKLVNILSVPREDTRRRKELKQSRPTQDVIDSMYNDHEAFWEGLKAHIPAMEASLGSDPAVQIAGQNRYREGGHILFRPVGLEAFARALRILMDRGVPTRQGVRALATTRLMLTDVPWSGVMWDPSRHAMNRTNLHLAESLLLYMVGERPASPKFDLEDVYRKQVGIASANLTDIPKGEPAR